MQIPLQGNKALHILARVSLYSSSSKFTILFFFGKRQPYNLFFVFLKKKKKKNRFKSFLPQGLCTS